MCSTSMHSAKHMDVKDGSHPLFNYTSGRWLYNESNRLAERRLPFNVAELCLVMAQSVNLRTSDIVHFAKIAEGGSYRVFEATFNSGSRVIARLPYPCTIPKIYGVASEVATMEFLRLHAVPIPKILAWSPSASNPVGSEYIVMERALGKELGHTWYTMDMKERMTVVEKIVEVEKILFEIAFPANGSIFFKDCVHSKFDTVSLPKNDTVPGQEKFCIGPSTQYLWWYQMRHELGANGGPWNDTKEVMQAVGERELAWLQKFGQPRYPREYSYREIYGNQKVDPGEQSRHLLEYLKLIPYLVPEEKRLNKPTIRHPDLSPNNIFVSTSGDITAIIDWQHATVLPVFLQAIIPKHFQNYGDDDSECFRRPKLPDIFNTLAEDQKEQEMELYRRRQVHYFYLGHTSHVNQTHFNAMGKHTLTLRHQLFEIAGTPWEGDNTSLQAGLIKILARWRELTGANETPIRFSPFDVEVCLKRYARQMILHRQLSHMRDFIGVDVGGWVNKDDFEGAKEKERLFKIECLEAADTDGERKEIEEHWPFQDHKELD